MNFTRCWHDWVSASNTRNYMLNDPLNDWLKYHGTSWSRQTIPENDGQIATTCTTDTITPTYHYCLSPVQDHDEFTEFIMKRGCEFENSVVEQLKETFQSNILCIRSAYRARDPTCAQETISAMTRGVPIIHGGVLHNTQNKTYGITDLLVRSDWIPKVIKTPPYLPRKKSLFHASWYYVVIDIKYSTLKLTADGVHLLNAGSYPAYKSQVYIYERALEQIQKCSVHKAFVLGRGWKLKNEQCADPLDRLGVVDYSARDKKYVEKTNDAIKWLRSCRSESSRHWNLTSPPLARPELYPNMCNTHDYPYHSIKKHLSSHYNDVTELWKVGPKHRLVAHENDVFSWTDERCTPNVLGIDSPYTHRILSSILDVNQPHTRTFKKGYKIMPQWIRSNFGDWKHSDTLEFFIDFETVSSIMFEVRSPMYTACTNFMFMIGVGFCLDGAWFYRNFTVNDMTFDEEERICREFVYFIDDMRQTHNVERLKCYHWAHAEKSFWNEITTRYRRSVRNWPMHWDWVDLLCLFKQEPITVRGALSYSLKDIARAMHTHGFIESIWPKHSKCKDGLSAMLCAVRSAEDSKRKQIPLVSDALVQDIIAYNEIDEGAYGNVDISAQPSYLETFCDI
jgi:hypothetical protein